jgi:multidrug efflux pump subunit AcrA (membrane-fusion protein)
MGRLVLIVALLLMTSCARAASSTTPAAESPASPQSTEAQRPQRELRLTGLVEAIHSYKVTVPQIVGVGGSLTLTRLIANGSAIKAGDTIAEFDATQQLDAAFTATAKYEDLSHQVEQKAAQNRADAEKRRGDLVQAQADLAKAQLDISKAEILSEIDAQKNQVRAEIARQHADSLTKSNALHDASDAAALRILELQRDRQRVAMDRAQVNIDRLRIRAPLKGMVAHQNIFRGGSSSKPQEGDQLFRGQPIVSIFDPSEMRVRCLIGEPDGVLLKEGMRVKVYLDAYPDLVLPGHFEFASPIAVSALGSPIKTFTAVFKLDKTDDRLMPDLSAAIVAEAGHTETAQKAGSTRQ